VVGAAKIEESDETDGVDSEDGGIETGDAPPIAE
jgi:hypothetical protein